MSNWFFGGSEIEELPDCVGFVYCITNNQNNRKYIGKKLAKFSKISVKTVTLKNGTKKKKKIRSQIDSDWRTYFGSSKELLEDVAALGEDNFTREILYICASKSACSYLEIYEQLTRRVLESDDYYNGIINCKIHKNHIKGKPL